MSNDPTTAVLVLGVLVAGWWYLSRAAARRRADRCLRYGHVPDPDTVGTWRETCRRCGARLR